MPMNWMASEALRTIAAKPREAGDDVIARLDRRHLGADRLDDPRTLVAEHNRPVEREPALAVYHMQIAVAHPGRRGADQHFAAPRLVDVDRFDRQRLVHLAKDRGIDLHLQAPCRAWILGAV